MTNNERLASIETILARLEPKVDGIRADLDLDRAELASIKNRGAGLLIGVSVAAAFVGAKLQAILGAIVATFK